jgi:hypothetical protein
VFKKIQSVGVATVVGVALLVPAAASAAEVPPLGYSNGTKLTTTHVPIIANGRIQLHSTVLGKIECVNTFWAEGWNAHEKNEPTKPERAFGEVLGWGTSSCTAPEEIASIEANKTFIAENHIPTPVTVVASSEMPVEKTFRQGEICKEETKTLAQCPNSSEREVKVMISSYHRRVSTLPWKVELIRGTRAEETGILEKIGMAEYGEAGTAEAHTTKCYPLEGTNPASFEKVPPGCIAVDIIFPQVPYEFVYYGTQEIWAVNGAGNGLDASKLEWIAPAGTFFSSKGAEGEGSTEGLVRLSGAEAVQLMTAR